MSFFTFSGKNLKLKYAIWALIWALFHAAIIYRLGYSWQVSLYDSIISSILLLIFCIASGNIMLYYQPSAKTAWKLVVWCFLLALVFTILLRIFVRWILNFETLYINNFDQTIPVRFVISFLLIGCVVLIVWIWEFVLFQKESQSRTEKAETLAREAELANITNQLQPHFLFNSLNSINSLINSKPTEARKMLQQLSDFFRNTLSKKENHLILFEKELKHINLYLDIEKVRFGHRMKVIYNIDENSKNCKLPHLILQPIVENAIKYGLYDTTGEVIIEINSNLEKDFLKIEIKNPIDSIEKNQPKGIGYGHSAVSRRLYLLFSRSDLLNTSNKDGIYSAVIYIPQNL